MPPKVRDADSQGIEPIDTGYHAAHSVTCKPRRVLMNLRGSIRENASGPATMSRTSRTVPLFGSRCAAANHQSEELISAASKQRGYQSPSLTWTTTCAALVSPH